MIYSKLTSIIAVLGLSTLSLTAEQPLVSNVQCVQRVGTKFVDITYDLSFSGGACTVSINVSNDGGRSYLVPAKTFEGHIGAGITPGIQRLITWDAAADFDGMLAEQMKVRVMARGGTLPIPPPHMVFIPGGHFWMGQWQEGSSASARQVYISPFFIDRFEVWGGLFQEVKTWAQSRGYIESTGSSTVNSISGGSSQAANHPVHDISWHNAVKWCNARSEYEGLTPVYYTDTSHTQVYRTGTMGSITNSHVKWEANGYRLPTEAEWEKAGRGALSGRDYPWGDELHDNMANFMATQHPWSTTFYGTNPLRTTPVGYFDSNQVVGGLDMANAFGLYDMAGNVLEWCWDNWTEAPSGSVNPKGPNSNHMGTRSVRSGCSTSPFIELRCWYRASASSNGRNMGFTNSTGSKPTGFRCVRAL
jgi:formylglycine-generating enzyme required for sulfatase activity